MLIGCRPVQKRVPVSKREVSPGIVTVCSESRLNECISESTIPTRIMSDHDLLGYDPIPQIACQVSLSGGDEQSHPSLAFVEAVKPDHDSRKTLPVSIDVAVVFRLTAVPVDHSPKVARRVGILPTIVGVDRVNGIIITPQHIGERGMHHDGVLETCRRHRSIDGTTDLVKCKTQGIMTVTAVTQHPRSAAEPRVVKG